MRKRIFEIIEVSKDNDRISFIYDITMLFAIIVSIVPLAFKESYRAFYYIDVVTTILFIIDYLLRWGTSDYKFKKKNITSFLIYPFSFWAIIDLVSILPTITVLNSGFKLLRLFRVVKTFRIFR